MNEAGRAREPFFFALDYELQEGIFLADPLGAGAETGGIQFSIHGRHTPLVDNYPLPSLLAITPETECEYAERFACVYKALERGDSFLTNLTIRTPIELEGSLEAIYAHSHAPYKLLVPDRFVCFSPERFVRISGQTISTNPMKGTIDAARPDAAEHLLADYKEGAEHYTIVDLMRNDLNRIAHKVRVERFKYLSHISTSRGDILQMSSEVVGDLTESWHDHIGDLILELLPAGSISGAPKAKTSEIIHEAESIPRGFYTGICGYYDGRELDSGVLIRYIEQDGRRQYYYRSGGGVTINSQCDEEYRECIQKVYLPCQSPS
ncbi:MAG: aminodeoxychorismate synthase component I [Porphyromonadaceae bacterium]|nr:aminodeoxychorismate synthase component I [Porphyromonadaceae bacterium]